MKEKIIRFITIIILFVFGTLAGYLGAIIQSKTITETYRKTATLKEDVVFDDDVTINKYGGPLVLFAGTQGDILDKIDYWGDEIGFEYIRIDFLLDDGLKFYAMIPIDSVVSESSNRYIIEASAFEDYQTIISEYQLSREIYYSKVNHQKTFGTVIGLGISVLISVVISCTYLCIQKKNKPTSNLNRTTIIIDIVILFGILFEIYCLY